MNPYLYVKRFVQKMRWNFFWKSFQLPEMDIHQIVPEYKPEQPSITEHLYLPPYKGTDKHNDISPLLNIVKIRNPSIVLELGTAYGATVANICRFSHAKVYTINALPEQLEGNNITVSLTRDEIGIVYRQHGYEDRVIQIYENTRHLTIQNYLLPHSVDLAIIDACHDADFVVNDFLRILPSLSNKAIVLFHDVHPSCSGHLLSSYVGCMYLRKLGYNVRHLSNTWWGIWFASEPISIPNTKTLVLNWMDSLFGRVVWGDITHDVSEIYWLATLFLR